MKQEEAPTPATEHADEDHRRNGERITATTKRPR